MDLGGRTRSSPLALKGRPLAAEGRAEGRAGLTARAKRKMAITRDPTHAGMPALTHAYPTVRSFLAAPRLRLYECLSSVR